MVSMPILNPNMGVCFSLIRDVCLFDLVGEKVRDDTYVWTPLNLGDVF